MQGHPNTARPSSLSIPPDPSKQLSNAWAGSIIAKRTSIRIDTHNLLIFEEVGQDFRNLVRGTETNPNLNVNQLGPVAFILDSLVSINNHGESD